MRWRARERPWSASAGCGRTVVALWKEAGRLGAGRQEVAALLHVAARALHISAEYAEAEAMRREELAAERETTAALKAPTLPYV